MRRGVSKVLAVLIVASGGTRLLAQESTTAPSVCCRAVIATLTCCGYTRCEAGKWECCSDGGCDQLPTGSTD